MTVSECIQYVDEVKPNAFPTEAKIAWVGQIEGRIASEIFLMAPAELAQFRFRTVMTDGDKELLLDPPYDDIYSAYLTAKVDSKNGEFNRMSTAAQAFNRLWNEFSAYIGNLYDPAGGYPDEESMLRRERPRPKVGRPPLYDPVTGDYAASTDGRASVSTQTEGTQEPDTQAQLPEPLHASGHDSASRPAMG